MIWGKVTSDCFCYVMVLALTRNPGQFFMVLSFYQESEMFP
jgi:hypothetical protein